VHAGVAILWDCEAWWTLDSPGLPSSEPAYLDAVRQAHRVLWRAGIIADFAHPSHDLSAYEAVLVPSLYLVSDEAARNIGRYVEGGGTLVVSFFSGVADEHARVRLGGHPGAFRDVLGVRVEEFLPLAEPVPLSNGDTGRVWSERVGLRGAVPLARYAAGDLDGLPALTRHEYGAGRAFYSSTGLDDDAYARLLAQAGLPACARPGVELVRRADGETTWLFALNHGTADQEIPAHGLDLVSGAWVADVLRLPPGGFAVLRERLDQPKNTPASAR
jgi:beta-galactosidase